MNKTLEFPVLLRLIDERSSAFRAAAESAADLDLKVPTCPEWTLADLVRHLGEVHRFWAGVVSAGPADAPPRSESKDAEPAPREREALLAWSAESTRLLLDALREAGPDRGCWTWWGRSEAPQITAAVARHQVQEASVHTYDAQITAGAPQPLPADAALDGIDEFLTTIVATTVAWPHEPAVVDFHATEGRSWRVSLSADGAHPALLGQDADTDGDAATASVRGTADELVRFLYARIPLDSLEAGGDQHVFEQLHAWEPYA